MNDISPVADPRTPPRLVAGGRVPAAGIDAPGALDWRLERADAEQQTFAQAAAAAWRFLVRHAATIGACIAVCLALGVAITLLTPEAYTARATLQIDRQSERVVNNEDQTPDRQPGRGVLPDPIRPAAQPHAGRPRRR